MNNRVSLQLPPDTFSALCAYMQESGAAMEVEELAAAAISEWVSEARKRAAVHAGPEQGYQWKQLFLPSGTHLRMYHDGTYHYAQVEGDQLIFKGRSVSPAQMANAVAGCTRNAWRDMWLRCPGETAWKLASVRRRQAQLAQHAVQAQQAGPGSATALPAPPVPHPAPVPPAAPGTVNQFEAVLRRMALLLEQSLEIRGPQYRRRSDFLDKGFEDD